MKQSTASRALWKRTAIAFGAGLCIMSMTAQAQQSSGAINGRAAKGDVVTVENRGINVTRQIKLDADGNFQVSNLPSGTYQVTLTRANGTKQTLELVVAAGGGSFADFGTTQQVVVTGTAARSLDVRSTESTQILTKAQIDRIPVARDVTAVAMLAPTVTFGDARLGQTNARAGNVPSIAGASPAENTYYVNGFNVTNIVNGVSYNTVPFEAIAEQQVKTGGYGAEFGRSLGGVLNINTKRGTNQWTGGANISYEPNSLKGSSVYTFRDPVTAAWSLKDRPGGSTQTKYNVWAGGPVIKDQLYVFGIVQGFDYKSETYADTQQSQLTNKTPQYLLKVDWNINKNNLFELTAFSDKSKDEIDYYNSTTPYETGKASYIGHDLLTTGGQNTIAKWTSWINEDLSVSALIGRGTYDRTSAIGGADCPRVIDLRTSTRKDYGCATSARISDPGAKDERDAARLDLEWVLGKHTVKAGLDHEIYKVKDSTAASGDGDYIIRSRNPGQILANGYVIPAGGPVQLVEFRHFENGGTFKTINSAWYLEDTIQLTDRIVASVGIRNESFKNKNADGVPFINIKNTWAPRLAASWDVQGDASLKVFGNLGRYYIPVYANTNVRLSGAELDYRDFYTYGGSLATDRFQRPVLGAQLGGRVVSSNGETPNPLSVVDPNIKPIYQDELILGFQKALAQRWSVGVKYTHRKLGNAMDDICNDEGPAVWAEANGYTSTQAGRIGAAIGHCFLYNPGKDLTANIDVDATGTLKEIVIPAAALQMPKPKRTFDSLEFTFERAWDKKWSFQGSYVLSFSKGNTEGYVKSDIGQDDAGISQDFDYPGLMEGAEGYLPNDRRHTLKAFGSYAVTDEWRVGGSATIQSGRPQNCFGAYGGTTDTVSVNYGDASFYCGGVLRSRGAFGRLPWQQQYDLQVTYTPNWAKGLTLSMDVLNVLNKRTVRSIDEQEDSGTTNPASNYGKPILVSVQKPRTVRLLAQYEF
ncbi:MAG: TonB-dependent receptor [Aquabacterium sp.]|nr:TonB-dependent receptor [Aquabacterium sp.]